MEEYINQHDTQLNTGEIENKPLHPDDQKQEDQWDKDIEDEKVVNGAYAMLTRLIILGNETHNTNLVAAAENLQEIIDTL